MTIGGLIARIAGAAFMAAVIIFMLAPIFVVIAVSFSTSPIFDLPTDGLTFRWYRELGSLGSLWPAVWLSVEIALVATTTSLVLGTLCAVGLIRGRFPGREVFLTFVLSPMMLPGVVLGIAMLFAFRSIGFRDAYMSLMLAHVVITVPYIVRIVYASLSLFDFSMIDAARTLGCTYGGALVKVLVPNIFPSFLTAGMFAFIGSMDNYAIALFLRDVHNVTLPVQILRYIEVGTEPTLAAISTIILLLTFTVMIAAERLVGLNRLAGE